MWYSYYGAYVEETSPTDDPLTMTITYPEEQLEPKVYLTYSKESKKTTTAPSNFKKADIPVSKALTSTEVIRARISSLQTFEKTVIPYIFLGESVVQENTTIVRKGKVIVDKPSLILPPNMPQFSGFEFENQDEALNFIFLRAFIVLILLDYEHTSSYHPYTPQ